MHSMPAVALYLAAAASPPPAVTYASGSDVAAAIRRAAASGPASSAVSLAARDEYRILGVKRTAAGSSELHEQDNDIWYVLEGGGTLVTAGELIAGKTTARGELRGTGIRGGQPRHAARGALITIGAATSHGPSAVS